MYREDNKYEDHWAHEEEGNLFIFLLGPLWEETTCVNASSYPEMHSPYPYVK